MPAAADPGDGITRLAAEIRDALRGAGDPDRAVGQQAYMKSAMPFWGVRVPAVRAIVRPRVRALDTAAAIALAETLWDDAGRREERYAALAALAAPGADGDLALAPTIERFVLEGRWWDIVDELAHRVVALLNCHPDEAGAIVRAWSVDRRDEPAPNTGMWLRRIAILSQLGRRDRIDLELLAEVVDANAADPEFFVRKAIGWSLRDAARVRPAWVRAFVASRTLSPLSRREALKHVG